MAKVIKNSGKQVQAWELSTGSEMERKLIEEGKIVPRGTSFELFSQESKNGSGEMAKAGDFFKVDKAGYPYPNDREWFIANHRQLDGDTYEQLPKALLAWEASEGITPEVQYLLDNKGLKLDAEHPEQFFGAELWGTWLTASKDAVLIFYSVTYGEDGKVSNADFNFVARKEFEAAYHYCD